MSKKTCIECGSTFDSITNTDTCIQCLLKPHKIDFEKEDIMPGAITDKSRKCLFQLPDGTVCNKSYIPSGNRQKNCPEHICKPTRSQKIVACDKHDKPAIQFTSKSAPVKISNISNEVSEDLRVINSLIALCFVSKEQVEKVRELVRL